MRLLAGCEPAVQGSIHAFGHNLASRPIATLQQIGYVSASQELPHTLKFKDTLQFCRSIYPNWDKELEKKLLNLFSLDPTQTPAQYSQGMQMKARILLALCYRPKLLLLDEPFNGFDEMAQEAFIQELIHLMTTEPTTILCATHHLHEVLKLGERYIMLHQGKIVEDAPIEALLQNFRKVNFTSSININENTALIKEYQTTAIDQFIECLVESHDPSTLNKLAQDFQVKVEDLQLKPLSFVEISLFLQKKHNS